MRTLNERERASRRLAVVVAAMLALALAAGLFGAIAAPTRQAAGAAYTSPLSYITVQ